MKLRKYTLKISETEVKYDARKSMNNPDTVSKVLFDYYKEYGEDKEKFIALILDNKNKILAIDEVSVGILDSALIHPREVFRKAILSGAKSIITAHNHPSGDSTPSEEDKKSFRKLSEAGHIIGINIIDNIIIGNRKYFSFSEKGLI